MKAVFTLFLLVLIMPGSVLYGQTWTVYTTANSGLPDGDLTRIITDPSDAKWIATRTVGLVRFDAAGWKVYRTANSGIPHDNGIATLVWDQTDKLYVGYNGPGGNGFYRFDGNTWARMTKFRSMWISDMAVDRNNTKWVSSGNHGNWEYDSMVVAGTGNFATVPLAQALQDALPVDSVDIARCFEIATDPVNDYVWFGVSTVGFKNYQSPVLVRYAPATQTWDVYPSANLYSGWPITKSITMPANMEVDHTGILWSSVSSENRSRNLFRFDGTTTHEYTPENSGLPDSAVFSLKADAQNRLWIATDAGLARFDGTEWLVFNMANSALPSNTIRDIAIDSKNQKWLTTNKGLVMLNDIAPAITAPATAFLCDNGVTFQDASVSIGGGIVKWSWDFGDSKGHSDVEAPVYTYSQAGTYAVQLTVEDVNGSVNSVTKNIVIAPGYSGGALVMENLFGMETAGALFGDVSPYPAFPGVGIRFSAITGFTPEAWDFGDNQSATEAVPVHVFSATGSYTVTLHAKDERGCPVISTGNVLILDPLITDTVTPNGDGKNDKLFIEPFLYAGDLKVVNRWGQSVYSTSDYTEGFSIANLQEGFYYFEVSFKDTGKQYKGHFQVIR